jgi:hypothetical protein
MLECEGRELEDKPLDQETGKEVAHQMTYDELSVLNIPPHHGVHKRLRGGFEQEGPVTPANWRRVRFDAERLVHGLFEPKTYQETIAERS